MGYSARGGSGFHGRSRKSFPKLRRHQVIVRETDTHFILDGGIHIPKDRPGAKVMVDAYVAQWDIEAHKQEELYNKRIDRYGRYLKKRYS